MTHNLIGIYANVHYSSFDEFAKTGHFYAVPYIVYSMNKATPECLFVKRPFEMFRQGMNIRDIGHLVKLYNDSPAFLQISGSSFKKMARYLSNNMEKVLADMVSLVIVKIIQQTKPIERFSNVFFINNIANDKLLGRLGYLCINLNSNLISMLTYQPESLMTNLANDVYEQLSFDIDYFRRDPNRIYSDSYPDNIMDSLTQTIFFKVAPEAPGTVVPLRLDIFAQGLYNVTEQIECIKDILGAEINLSPPLKTSESSSFMARIPSVLYECIEAAKGRYSIEVEDFLEHFSSLPK